MSASTGVLWRILREKTPIAVVFYPERTTRQELIESVRLLAPDGMELIEAEEIDAAFRDPDKLILLLPADEEGAVDVLDRQRDALCDRTAPVVLFLLCGGRGERRLSRAFALASWLRGREYDPERPTFVDQARIEEERRDFALRAGRSPEEWLAAWRTGDLPDTLENNLFSHDAFLLEGVTSDDAAHEAGVP